MKLRLVGRSVLAAPWPRLSAGGTITPGRARAVLRAGRFYLLSLLYGAAVYGFLVAYLLGLGAMIEPAPTS